uniref:Nuclear receptor n=1 Tax=Parastrongyloides trichosuri TaxID=131310 RepID=A0A0N5A3S3_PARTI
MEVNFLKVGNLLDTSEKNEKEEKKVFKLQTALCSICNEESSGIHFGAESCGSCSAFFRRSIVMGKIYSCQAIYCKTENKWKKCKACRLKKCFEMGMVKSAVQNKRDAIGKQSKQGVLAKSIMKNSSSPLNKLNFPSFRTIININFTPDVFQYQPFYCLNSEEKSENVLEEIFEKYQTLNKERKLLYSDRNSIDLFNDDLKFEPTELKDFSECIFLIWRIEPRLLIKFISSNKFLNCLCSEEKLKIYKHFIPHFQALEEPYLTWINGGLDLNWWMMPNKTYIDMNKADEYFSNEKVLTNLKLDKETTVKLFVPSFKNALELVAKVMATNNINEYEMIFLIALILFDTTISDIKKETISLLEKLKDQAFKDIYFYEKYHNNCSQADVRIGNIIMILSGVKIHAKTVTENLHLLRTFSILPKEKLFDMNSFV